MHNFKEKLEVRKQNILRLIAPLIICFLATNLSTAQLATTSELHQTLKANDSLLFEVGFNQCDLSQFENLFSEDFEFYHDQGGIDASKEAFMASMKNGLCSSGSNSTRRELVAGSLEVYPLYNDRVLYGAIQKGIHRFCETTAKFMHLWLLENGEWKVSRVLSYDHKNP